MFPKVTHISYKYHPIKSKKFHGGLLLVLLIICSSLAHPVLQENSATNSEKLFLEAKKYFAEKNYWDAARDLIVLLDFNTDYQKTDEVIFALGECMYEIGLQQGASKLYKHLVNKYIRSPFMPKALLGLQRIEYDRKDFGRCIEYHDAISRSHPPQHVLDASLYFAGLSYFNFRDFPRAIKLFNKISANSPYYEFGQYTMALSQLRMKNIKKAIALFKNICALPVDSDERRNIIDETHQTLGYIYYELGFYSQAYNQFMTVSANHENYDAALLAAGWTCTRMEDYIAAVVPLTTLVNRYSQKENVEEGYFLLGRCFLKLKMYEQALNVYDQVIKLFPSNDVIPAITEEVQTSLSDEEAAIEKIKTDLLVLESNLLDCLPLNESDKGMPDYLQEERKMLLETRHQLIEQIQEERKSFDLLATKMQELQQIAARRQTRKDWRAYAEYGKSRALYLLSLQ